MTKPVRVVVTGIGAVSAAGVGAERLWAAARDGRPCINPPVFPYEYRGRIKIAAQVQDFDPTLYLDRDTLPFCDPVSQYLLVAADEALAQAGFDRQTRFGPRGSTIIGTGIGGMITIEEGIHLSLIKKGRPHPLMIPKLIPSACPANLSMRYGLQGPSFAVVSACSSATQAIGIGMQLIRSGTVDVAVVGGTEDCIINNAMFAWEALRVMTPDFCRPFSKGRNGMILGAGAGFDYSGIRRTCESPGRDLARRTWPAMGRRRTRKIRSRRIVHGCGAGHVEARSRMPRSITDEIDYVNAHGTATIVNDSTESAALHQVFGERAAHVPLSSTKPIHGHGLGAAGALEFVVSMGAIRDQIAPPTINYLEPDVKCPVDAIPNVARPMKIKTVMSNSFAFGGINAVLVIQAPEAA